VESRIACVSVSFVMMLGLRFGAAVAASTGYSPGDQVTWASGQRLTAIVRLPAVSLRCRSKSNGLCNKPAEVLPGKV
jgi:hypothetical protein